MRSGLGLRADRGVIGGVRATLGAVLRLRAERAIVGGAVARTTASGIASVVTLHELLETAAAIERELAETTRYAKDLEASIVLEMWTEPVVEVDHTR